MDDEGSDDEGHVRIEVRETDLQEPGEVNKTQQSKVN